MSKDFFVADKLKTRVEKEYLMSLAERPVMVDIKENEEAKVSDGPTFSGSKRMMELEDLATSRSNRRILVPGPGTHSTVFPVSSQEDLEMEAEDRHGTLATRARAVTDL